MNLKHEMFWNSDRVYIHNDEIEMNLKHEMFWNNLDEWKKQISELWTLNMKCFEIVIKLIKVIVAT